MRWLVFVLSINTLTAMSCKLRKQPGDNNESEAKLFGQRTHPTAKETPYPFPPFYYTQVHFKEISGGNPAQITAAVKVRIEEADTLFTEKAGLPSGLYVLPVEKLDRIEPVYLRRMDRDEIKYTWLASYAEKQGEDVLFYAGENKYHQQYHMVWSNGELSWGPIAFSISRCHDTYIDRDIRCQGEILNELSMHEISKKYFQHAYFKVGLFTKVDWYGYEGWDKHHWEQLKSYRDLVSKHLCNAKPTENLNEYVIKRHKCDDLGIVVQPFAMQFLQSKGVTCKRNNSGVTRKMTELRFLFHPIFTASNKNSLLASCSDNLITIARPKEGGAKITIHKGQLPTSGSTVREIIISAAGKITSGEQLMEESTE